MTIEESERIDGVLDRALERLRKGSTEFRRFSPQDEVDLILAGEMWRNAFMDMYQKYIQVGTDSMALADGEVDDGEPAQAHTGDRSESI